MYYKIGADLKDVRSCNLHTFLDRSIFKILHLISFLLVHLGFTMPFKLQTVNRAATPCARYGLVRLLHSTVVFERCGTLLARYVSFLARYGTLLAQYVSFFARNVSGFFFTARFVERYSN